MSNLKSQEFRIGNLLQDQLGNLLKITDLNDGVQGITYRPLDRRKKLPKECIRAQEIPLTEECLLKFGFVCHPDGYCILECLKYGFTISYNDYKSAMVNMCMGTYCSEGNDIHHIKYVHQLQNLYFSLTGEELKYHSSTI